VATRIRRDVTGDMYRIGIGVALILILLPVFILAVITKFFADRSRASQRMAEAKRKEAEYHRMGQQVTEAKLAALQAQVEPHFLYNTLASVQALTEVDPAKASAMTGHLIQYLRNALPKMRESVSTVGQEVELVRAYLSILQMRMGERLAFDIDVPEALAAMPFPPLMLPSLVENAIKHGLEPQREGGPRDHHGLGRRWAPAAQGGRYGPRLRRDGGRRRRARQHPRTAGRALWRCRALHPRGERAARRGGDHRGAGRGRARVRCGCRAAQRRRRSAAAAARGRAAAKPQRLLAADVGRAGEARALWRKGSTTSSS
jgi:hypothetical protein